MRRLLCMVLTGAVMIGCLCTGTGAVDESNVVSYSFETTGTAITRATGNLDWTINGLMTETRATKHERKPGRWHPSRLSLCWNFANLLGYGYYTTPIVVYASGE